MIQGDRANILSPKRPTDSGTTTVEGMLNHFHFSSFTDADNDSYVFIVIPTSFLNSLSWPILYVLIIALFALTDDCFVVLLQ